MTSETEYVFRSETMEHRFDPANPSADFCDPGKRIHSAERTVPESLEKNPENFRCFFSGKPDDGNQRRMNGSLCFLM